MPFGLVNAPSSFQRAMEIILAPCKWKFVLVYFDDIIVLSSIVEEQIEHVNVAVISLRKSGLSLKINKCNLFTRTVKYLGQIVRRATIEIDQATSRRFTKSNALLNTNRTRIHSKVCFLYHVKWFGYDDGTLKPASSFWRNIVVRYHNRKKMSLPPDINDFLVLKDESKLSTNALLQTLHRCYRNQDVSMDINTHIHMKQGL